MLRHRFAWKRPSLAGALLDEPDGSDAHRVFRVRPGASTDQTRIESLSVLTAFEPRPVPLIRDGLPSDHRQRMSDWIALTGHDARLATRRKPALNADSTRIQHN